MLRKLFYNFYYYYIFILQKQNVIFFIKIRGITKYKFLNYKYIFNNNYRKLSR